MCNLVLYVTSFMRPHKINRANLDSEILATKVSDHDNQSNDFNDADSITPQLDDQNKDAPHHAERRSHTLSQVARPPPSQSYVFLGVWQTNF